MLDAATRFPADSHPFPKALRQAVDEFFVRTGTSRYADWRLWMKAVLLVSGLLTIWYVLVTVRLPGAVALAFATVLGCLVAAVGMAVGHDALHGSFSARPWINWLVGCSFDLIGANSYIWRYSHNRTHHLFTNVEGVDLDLDLAPGLAVSPRAPRVAANRWQHLYAPLLYSLTTIHWLFAKDIRYYTLRRMGSLRKVRHPWWAWAWLIGGKVFALSTHLVIPLMVAPYPWSQVLIGFLAMHVVAGLLMTSVFQLAHQAAHAQFPVADGGTLPWSFFVHQLHTTANFACTNRALTWFVGGLNFQVEHHLFPKVASVHYPALRPIVREVAKRYGLPYHEYPSLTAALRAHFTWLREQARQGWTPMLSVASRNGP